MKKLKLKACLTGMLVFICTINSYSQTINLRKESEVLEFKNDSLHNHLSFLLFPVTDESLFTYESKPAKKISSNKNFLFEVFSPEMITRYNSKLPFGWNDGAMIPNRGLQSLVTTGIYIKKKFLSIQIKPELLLAQNKSFISFPKNYSDQLWFVRYNFYNQIDNPERFSNIKKLYPGQSNIKFHYKKLSTGISTENRWWGPGKYNSILMSNNAPGFTHVFLQTERPIRSKIGYFEFQFIAGNLIGSGEIPPDTGRVFNNERLYKPKPQNDKRYLNGLAVVYQPSFAKGLSIGLGRVFYLYQSDRKSTFDGYVPVFGFLFKDQTTNEDEKKRDQMLSVYLKQTFEKGKSNVYLEFARNDHASSLRDLITDPFHSRAYIAGINKYYKLPKRYLNINIEVSELSRSAKTNLRPTPYWYTHHQVVHGYTNYGQVIGAGIGPGSAMQSVTADFIKSPSNSFSFHFFRIEQNKDFFYDAFLPTGEYNRKWVDLVLGGKLNKSFKYFNLRSSINFVRSFNYQWLDISSAQGELKKGTDISNFSAEIGVQLKLY